jgi:hypothetical protein
MLSSLLAAIPQLLRLLESLIGSIRQRKKADDVQKANKNPTGWFNNHFSGVPDDSDAPRKTSDNGNK